MAGTSPTPTTTPHEGSISCSEPSVAVATTGKVYILRGDERIRVNVRHVLSGKAKDVAVEADDRIYVGESVF